MRAIARKPEVTRQTTSAKLARPGRARSGQGDGELHPSLIAYDRQSSRTSHDKNTTVDVEGALTATDIVRFGHDFSRIPVHPKMPAKIQTRLKVNAPGDIYEQEAERVSERVMRTPEPRLQRACSCGGGCSECQTEQPEMERERLQTKRIQASDQGQIEAPPLVHEVLASPGRPLDPATRSFMEPRFGHDFSRVRVHADARAAQSSEAVNA